MFEVGDKTVSVGTMSEKRGDGTDLIRPADTFPKGEGEGYHVRG